MRLHKDVDAFHDFEDFPHPTYQNAALLPSSNEALAVEWADCYPDDRRRRLHNFLTDAFADPTRDDLGRLWRQVKGRSHSMKILRMVYAILSDRIAEADRLETRSNGLLKSPKRHAKR